MTEIKERMITDIALATYITCDDTVNNLSPILPKRVQKEKHSGKSTPYLVKSEFVFDDTLELKEKILKFYSHEGRVDPVRFNESLRNLKSFANQSSLLSPSIK